MVQTLAEAIQEAYEKGWVNDPDDPWVDLDCYGSTDPRTTQQYNCEECPLEAHCCEAWDEAQSGVGMQGESRGFKRWVLHGIWLIIVVFGTYYLVLREEYRMIVITGVTVLTYAYLLWKQNAGSTPASPIDGEKNEAMSNLRLRCNLRAANP